MDKIDLIVVYVGKKAYRNLKHGLENGIWGFRDSVIGDLKNHENKNTYLILATGYSDGSPRTKKNKWMKNYLEDLYLCKITSDFYRDTSEEWPDEHDLKEDERYIWRINFKNVSHIRNVELKKIGEKIGDKIRKSAIVKSRGYLIKDLDYLELKKIGFEINSSRKLINLLKEFRNEYKQDVKKKFSADLKSYEILVKDIPNIIEKSYIQNYEDMSSKGSIGMGNSTYYPWVIIYDNNISSGASSGFYIAILFSDDFEEVYLTLNQGAVSQTKDDMKETKEFIYKYHNKVVGFQKGRLPKRSLVKNEKYSSTNKGRNYEEAGIFYKQFKIRDLEKSTFEKDLKEIIVVYNDCAKKYLTEDEVMESEKMDYIEFYNNAVESNLKYSSKFILRFVSSLITKPFLLLTGLSGSGKTKISQAFVEWICNSRNQFSVISVGANWNNSDNLLGYPNPLSETKYTKPESGVLDLLLEASKDHNRNKPYFIILDEMNLSHVERYFSDFLSCLESGEPLKLHSDKSISEEIPMELEIKNNIYIIGTVNIDETTYMFSPKVLDRANVMEFKVEEEEMEYFLENPCAIDLNILRKQGANMASDFLKKTRNDYTEFKDKDLIKKELLSFFSELKKIGAEFGYRTAMEMFRLSAVIRDLNEEIDTNKVIDVLIIQKLLPKLHGSRRSLAPVLESLKLLCKEEKGIKYELSYNKLLRMESRLEKDGFTTFAEA